MGKSTILSDAIHILVYLDSDEDHPLTSKAIADSVNTNPAAVRKIMRKLKLAGIISSSQGKVNPKLNRDPSKITLYDIYIAVDGSSIFKPDYNTGDNCYISDHISDVLEIKYHQIQQTVFDELKQMTLSNVINDIDLKRKL